MEEGNISADGMGGLKYTESVFEVLSLKGNNQMVHVLKYTEMIKWWDMMSFKGVFGETWGDVLFDVQEGF